MVPQQEKIFNWLQNISTSLAELYDASVKMIDNQNFPAKYCLISHCVREIGNRLPSALQHKKYDRLEYHILVEPIAKIWKDEGLDKNKIVCPENLDNAIQISYSLYRTIDELLGKHKNTNDNIRNKYCDLLRYTIPENLEQNSDLYPVVRQIKDLIGYFQKIVHAPHDEEKEIDENEFKINFESFEHALSVLISGFYENQGKLEELTKQANENNSPTKDDVDKLIHFFSWPQLKVYFFRNLINPNWLLPLKERGFFDWGKQPVDWFYCPELFYLEKMADICSINILEIIKQNKDCLNEYIQSGFVRCLLQMPNDAVVEGIKYIPYINNESEINIRWFHLGEDLANLMEKLSEDQIDSAFFIAKKILSIQKDKENDKAYSGLKEYHYKDLLFKYYSKLWEKDAFRAFKILCNQLNNYLKEIQKNKGRDASLYVFSGYFESIDEIDEKGAYGRKIELIILKGLREIGKAVLDKQCEKIDELFAYIEKNNFEIFKHLEIYLLRFVTNDDQKERIQKILLNDKFIYKSDSYNEYILLLRDKGNKVDKKVITQIIDTLKKEIEKDAIESRDWVESNKKEKIQDFDIEKYKSMRFAKWLYPVKDSPLFAEFYKKHNDNCKLTEEELRPEPRVAHAEWVNEKEGSVISFDEMIKMEPLKVIEKLKDKENWKYAGKRWGQDKEGGAISHVFENVVKERFDEYIVLEPATILKLKPLFVDRYMNGLLNALGDNKERKGFNWVRFLNFGIYLNETKGNDKEYDWTYKNILSSLDGVISEKSLKKSVIDDYLECFWGFVESLCKYDDGREEESDSDPHQRSINCVQGKVFELAIRTGLVCKNIAPDKYQTEISGKLKNVLEYVLHKVSYEKVRCVLGVWLPQIHWLERDWVEKNIDKIFNEQDYSDWNVIWGSYLNWSRAYKNTFLYLYEKGKYDFAMKYINEEDKYKRSRVPAEGIVEHLMIAFFNGWIEYEHPLLQQFYSTATPPIKGKAASFLKTGFESVRNENDKVRIAEKGERLKKYWEKRIEEISLNPEPNFEEAIEFVDWVEDTLIEPNETLGLVLKTLELTKGKLGANRDEVSIVQGACKIGKGNELLALKCINKMMQGKPEWMSFSLYEEDLKTFLGHIVDLNKDTKDITEIRKEAIELVDAYGRRQIDGLRPYYDKLKRCE